MNLPHPLSPPERVAIVAVEPVIRAGLAAYFQAEAGWEVVALDPLDQNLEAALVEAMPDLVVWDAAGDEAELHRLNRHLSALPPTLVLVGSPEDAEAAWAAGARAVMRRHIEPQSLLTAARAILAGLWISDEPPRQQPRRKLERLEDLPEALTPREVQVLRLVADGLPNKVIATRLSVTESTVKFHVNAILRKLDARSRTEAVIRAGRIGLIPL